MSFSEWSNKKKAKQEEQEEKRKENTLAVTGHKTTFADWSDNKVANNVDENFINKFFSDASNFLKSAEKDYSGIKWGNASSVYNSKYNEWNDLNRRRKIINIWLNNNKDRIDEKFHNSLSEYLSNYDKAGISTINAFESVNEYYSQWETEEDYKKAVKAQEDYDFLVSYNFESGQKGIDYLTNELNAINATERAISKLESEKQTYELAASKGSKDASNKLEEINKQIDTYNDALKKAWEKYGSKNQLEAEISKRTSQYNRAKVIQDGIKLTNDAVAADDFEEKSQYVSTKDGDGWWDKLWSKDGLGYNDPTYEYINNIDNYRDEYEFHYVSTAPNPNSAGESDLKKQGLAFMTDEEIAIYNYYYATEGKEKAESYLKTIQESLNARKANKDFEKYEGNTFAEILFGVEAGIDQFKSGISNLFNTEDDYIPPSSTQMLSSVIREDLADASIPMWYNFKEGKWEDKVLGNSLGQGAYDLTTTTSNMLPSIITSYAVGVINPVAGQVVGAGLMGGSAAGNAYAEMLNLGYDKGQARLYSSMVGASEATLQYLLGGVGKLGGKLTNKAVIGIANNMDNAFARVAIKLGGNMAGEFTEEYLQEVLNPFFKNLTLGTNEDVTLFSSEALYNGILGALSAGILEGGSTIASDVKTNNLGKNVQKIDGGVARLKKLGTTFSADSVAYQIADKITEETGAYKIGLLLQEAGATLSEQNVSDIVIELTKKGMDESSAKKIAKLYQEFLNGEMSLTDEQVETLESLEPLANVLRKSIIGRNSAVYQRTREYNDLVQLATEMESESKESSAPQTDTEVTRPTNVPYSTEYIESVAKEYEAAGMSPEQAKIMAMAQLSASAEGKPLPTEENTVESKYEVSVDGKTINTKNDEIVTIKNIESISGDGEVNLTLDDGMVVKASDLSFGSDAEAIFVENIGAIKVGKNPISTTSANALYHTAMKALKDNPNMTASEADSLIRGLIESYVYGTYNLGRSKLTARNKDGSARLFAGELSQEHRQFAYELGTQDSVSKAEADQKVIDELKAKAEGKITKKSLGKIIFEKGADVDESTLTKTQRANLNGIKLLAEISSIEFHVFRSDKVGNTFKYTMPDGTVTSANGWFVAGTNEIWIDLNAGNAGEGTMIRTAAHEISHYIKEKSPKQWKAMADLLMKSFAENNVDTERMLNRQIAKIKKRYKNNKQAMPSESELLEMAHEELVSDALSDMLTDGSIVNFIAEVKAKDANLAKRILDAIKSLLKKWGLIIDDYKGRDLDTPEAQALSQLEDTFKKLQEMYREAFMDANETVALVSDIASIDAESKSVAPMMSERTWTASEYVTEREKTAKAISSTLGVDIKTAYKYIDDINSVARLIADDRVRLDYDPNIDEDATVLKKNSEYKYSVDMSTLCAKRLLTTGTFDAIQRKLPNTVFTSEDIVALREMMLKRGYEVACGICYVESTRREMGRITQDFINSYIESQKTGKPIRRINSSGKAVDLKKTKDEMLTTADKSADKFYADKDYTPTLADLNTTDIDLVKKEHPLVYEAYLNFMNARGQAKPKLLETRAEYKGEILKHFKSSSAVKSRNDAGGLRLQSFSDFEVPHLIDMMQVIMDMSRVGLKSQAYTKVPAFAEVFGNTGVKINLSLIAKGSGLDANGNLIFDDVEGINHEEAFKLRDKFSKNVGTILVGKTDAHIIAAMADPRIDYIIPFHKSSWKESLYEALGLTGYADYTDFQNEKPIDKGRKIKNFDPSEYWDFTKSGDENAQIYLEKCRKDGRIPKFPQFQGYPGYWKLLIDFKMYDNDGVGSPQEVVNPTFEMDAANKILDEYKGGHRNFPVAKDVVEDFVNDYVNNVKFSERDSEGKELSKGQQEFFKDSKVRDENGNLLVMYHGTDNGGFTIFDPSKSDDKTSLFLTASKEMAQTYAISSKEISLDGTNNQSGIYSVYANITNPYVVDAKGSNWNKIRTGLNPFSQSTRDIAQKAKRKGYDGVIIKNLVDAGGYSFMSGEKVAPNTVVIAFDSNQIKSVDNANPTSDPDIRYSERDTAYMDAVNNGDMETAQRLVDEVARENGYRIKGYHGTDIRFTIFDREKTSTSNDFGQGFYFSSSEFEAEQYQKDDVFGDTYNKIDGIAYDSALERIRDMGEDANDDALFTQIYNEEFDKELKRRTDEGAVINAYLKMEKPFIVSMANWITEEEAIDIAKNTMYADDVPDDIAISDWIHSIKAYAKQHDGKVDTHHFANNMGHAINLTNALLHQGKYDGILDYTVGKKFNTLSDYHAIALYPNKIKDSSPVTYDDNGNVISLSQRFNSKNNDIRYQERGATYGEIREVLAKQGLDELSKKLGGYFPLSASFDATMMADDTPLKMETVKAGGVHKGKKSAFVAGRNTFKNTYGINTNVYIEQMGIDATLYQDIAGESISKVIGKEDGNVQTILDVIPHIKDILSNSILMSIERIAHTDGKGSALFGYRLYNLYWYQEDNKKTPHCLVCTVVQSTDKAEGYVFRDIENVTIDLGLPSENTDMPESVNDDKYTVSQLYRFVKRLNRENGGIKYSPKEKSEYGFTYTKRNDGVKFQERDTDTSNRSLLANALESAAQNDIEKNKLAQYKEKISLIEAEEQRLSEIQKQLFSKDAVEPAKRKELQFEAKQISNRINTYDRQLLNLEATTALKNVLKREKALAMKKQKQIDAEYIKQYKEKVQNDKKALVSKYQESRKKAVESRTKTAMRHKIKNVVSELNRMLLKGSKERNVKLDLQNAVASALDAINMDTIGAEERIAKLEQELLKAKTPEKIQEISRKIDNIRGQGDRMSSKLNALKRAYEKIKANDDNLPNYFTEEASLIIGQIEATAEKVGDTPLRYMSLNQLEAVHDLYNLVLTTVRNANKVFVQGKLEDLQHNASATMEELSSIRTLPEERADFGWLRSFSWNEMIPVYAFRRIGSKTFEKFFWEAIRGQNVVAQDLSEANDFAKDTREKYGYKKWDLDKVHEFKLADGRTFRVTLRHMMSIYAYSKRNQALDHMTKGGFFFNDKSTFRKKGGIIKLIKSNEVGYSIDLNTLEAIVNEMTPEQRKYVDDMQTYLTQMGDKGNEVSRVLWGIDIFKEKVYFPLKSVKDFIYQTNQTAQESSLKNDGMTKETKPGASNPIVLEAFDDVWASHVNRMSQYHGLVIPIENLNKIHNYGTWANTESMSVSTMLRARFGEAVNDYLNNFIKDLNGATSVSGASNPFFSFVGKFKKTAVAASASVVVQQPTAIARAAAVMDMKYFIGLPKAKSLSAQWSELQKYAPIAIIKEIGGFDAGAGRQATEWLNSDTRRGIDKIEGKIDDITMKGAAIGDQIGWCTIWEAVKREIKSTTDLKVGSEEFLKKAGERFTEVIVLTQVYDSTLSRSGFMRSKHDSLKMLTAFMGEPTVSINMMADATIQAKRGTITKRKAGRIIGAVYTSIILASIASSLIYGLRDDDEDESYLEKFAEALGGKLLDEINPFNMLLGIRDIISIFDGWDVQRTDMAVFKDIKDAFDGLSSDNKSAWRKVEDFTGAIASIFGVPLKNVLRSARETYNAISNIFDDVTPSNVDDAFVRGVTGEKKDKSKSLYDAIINGDDARLEIYRKEYTDDKAYETAVRKALRENDPRIKEAAEARIEGNIAEYARIVREIKSEGLFSQDTIVASVNAEINALNKGESSATNNSAAENKESSIYTMDDYYASIVGGGHATAYVVKEDIIKTDVANGKDRDEAEDNFNSRFASHVREQYEDGYISDYEAEKMLVNYGGKTEQDAASKVQYWSFKQEYPDYDDLSEEAVDKYYNDVESHGISIHVYYDYSKQRSKCKGTDKNGDGKTDSGSVKAEVLRVINSLPITKAQKDALYYLNGWSARTIYEAPWR